MSNILRSQERSDVLMHVSGNLRKLRTDAGLSQTALANASGISRRMIVGVESGDANISLSSLDKLAAALGVDFVELVRDPSRTTRDSINAVTWRGEKSESKATLLGSVPASTEAQMWYWTLGAGDRYVAEPDPIGWHEMLFVTEGTLTLQLSGSSKEYPAGTFAIYSSAQIYSYINNQATKLGFVRNVLA
ncbi:helix-turn-helix domain-containing protein [Brucella pituitosa]|uniref:helix-turn-helix domain-containing protein n=1 Tax=Brucella pituitosa TaxID=571256 RepID=UPI000C279C44|nr:helix-turn-helix transcriptional regulator [Brucella pituitosa]PJO48123.1 Cro/Cl family transcriptional regulator [Brucella pituitosa]